MPDGDSGDNDAESGADGEGLKNGRQEWGERSQFELGRVNSGPSRGRSSE